MIKLGRRSSKKAHLRQLGLHVAGAAALACIGSIVFGLMGNSASRNVQRTSTSFTDAPLVAARVLPSEIRVDAYEPRKVKVQPILSSTGIIVRPESVGSPEPVASVEAASDIDDASARSAVQQTLADAPTVTAQHPGPLPQREPIPSTTPSATTERLHASHATRAPAGASEAPRPRDDRIGGARHKRFATVMTETRPAPLRAAYTRRL
jgi:hypothetical protein